MKKNYSKELIRAYVLGDDLGEYNIEELENDYLFMIGVIKYTKDKNMYELCSDELKLNYNLVKFLVTTFKTDIPFITKVANYYLKNSSTEIGINLEADELTILMNQLTNKEDDYDFINYRLKAKTIYWSLVTQINLFLEEEKVNYPESASDLGMGFSIVMNLYGDSDILMNYFAKEYLTNLFKDKKTLEAILHQKFSQFDHIEKIGIYNFFIRYINEFDQSLGSYVNLHLELLKELINKLESIKLNWNTFETKLMKEKIDIILENTQQILMDNKQEYNFNTLEIVYYLIKKLGLIDEIKGYNEHLDILDKEYKEIEEMKDYYDNTFNQKILSIKEIQTVTQIKNIIISTLKRKSLDESISIDEYLNETKLKIHHKTKILKFSLPKE